MRIVINLHESAPSGSIDKFNKISILLISEAKSVFLKNLFVTMNKIVLMVMMKKIVWLFSKFILRGNNYVQYYVFTGHGFTEKKLDLTKIDAIYRSISVKKKYNFV